MSMKSAIALAFAAMLISPALALANHCASAVIPAGVGSHQDTVYVINTGGADSVTYTIYNNSGVQQGTALTTTIPANGRDVHTVGELYAAAGVPLSDDTYIQVREGDGDEFIVFIQRPGNNNNTYQAMPPSCTKTTD